MMERIRRARQEDGFTLIEVLVVISILGILAGIVVFSVAGLSNRGQADACKTDKATLQTAVQAYFAQNSVYPANGSSVAGFTSGSSSWHSHTGGGTVAVITGNGKCT